ncbi:nuclease PIN [Mycobacterium sp. 1554424.7]|nr:nuclease PIN [Mycobacterium sp. 1554424.7]
MNPQDPYGYGPLSYDPLGRVPPAAPPVQPPVVPPPPAEPYRPPVNAMATRSLVFAFASPPVGAMLGHLALGQIRRTGELGRNRALAAVAVSYAIIGVAVLALVAWAALAAFTSAPNRPGAPATTAAAPPGPTVAPDAIATILPGLDDLKTITDDQNLEAGPTRDHAGRSADDGSVDRPECWGSIGPGVPDAYTTDAIAGYHAQKFSDTRSLLKSMEVLQVVIAFRDAPTAQSQLAQVLSGWRQCGGKSVGVTFAEGGSVPFSVGAPADAGNGITTLDLVPKGLQVRLARAIAGRANVVVDLLVASNGTTDGSRARQAAVSIANYALNKIPG